MEATAGEKSWKLRELFLQSLLTPLTASQGLEKKSFYVDLKRERENERLARKRDSYRGNNVLNFEREI